jgi:hypothetical protein
MRKVTFALFRSQVIVCQLPSLIVMSDVIARRWMLP